MASTFCETKQPIERVENGTAIFAVYLPSMMTAIETETEEASIRKITFSVDFGETGLKTKGNLVGLAGFYYDANYYWATTADKVISAWAWFMEKIQVDNAFYEGMESIIVREFFAQQVETGLTPPLYHLP